ncbi:MAG: hypothetical protein IT173_16330 [Acidobacteria bacterium]|nr:hypothetical protein [Acidobacteriota bacterium]
MAQSTFYVRTVRLVQSLTYPFRIPALIDDGLNEYINAFDKIVNRKRESIRDHQIVRRVIHRMNASIFRQRIDLGKDRVEEIVSEAVFL